MVFFITAQAAKAYLREFHKKTMNLVHSASGRRLGTMIFPGSLRVGPRVGTAVLVLGMIVSGCSTRHYQRSADVEVYEAIAQKTPRVPNMDPEFSITDTNTLDLSRYPINETTPAFFGSGSTLEVGHRIMSLEEALEIAVHHNRRYQNEKESLYLQALSLTLSRHQYTPIFSSTVGVQYGETRSESERRDPITDAVDLVTETERPRNFTADLRADVLLRSGGRIATAFTTDFLRYLIGDRTLASSSRLVGEVSQPLLRGAGYKIQMEALTQAERNLLYSLRDFTRFRKEFTVDIVSEYYRVLQDRDRVRNAWEAYQNFQANVRREKALYEEGLARKADVAELQESELTNEQSWIDALRTYRENLDRLKISLGLKTDTPIILDDAELQKLKIDEAHERLRVEEAVEIAFASRLDLHTIQDRVEDSERRMGVAANALLPQVDLVASGSYTADPRADYRYPSLDFNTYSWNAGLDVELPLDRKAERNAYRAALIDHERARRELENYTDEVRLQIQNGWRNLEQAKREYEISRVRVELSRSRVREQELLNEIGQGDAFELVRAQDALTGSRNQLTSALINHTLARLGFWRDLGQLYVQADGQWSETSYGDEQSSL